jgi:hypothetical protein
MSQPIKRRIKMFKLAKPIFPENTENEMNRLAVFRAKGDLRGTEIKIAAADFYRAYVNGKFLAFGPARYAKGYARVDVLDPSALATGDDELVIAVVGYHCPYTISLVLQPSFLCAELIENGDVTAATGAENGFLCRVMTEHEQKAQRYAGQRTFCEVYNLTPKAEAWERTPARI